MSDPDKWGIDLTPDEADTFMAAIREARRGPDLPDPLVALRAEVEALRTLASGAYDDAARFGLGVDIRTRMGAYKDAYATVLDLIDKHAREGQ